MEWKKVKTCIRKIFCVVLATAMLVTGVLSQTQTAQAEVYRSTSLRGTYRRVKTVSGITCIDRNLTTNRNYYYKVRAYKIIGNKKYYTPFSGAKKIRM